MNRTLNILVNEKPLSPPIFAEECKDFISRLKGLMGKRELKEDKGIILVQKSDSRMDSAIHMVAVFMDLGIVWINSQMIIVDKVVAKSWRPFYMSSQPAMYTLEVHPDRINEFAIHDKVTFHEIA